MPPAFVSLYPWCCMREVRSGRSQGCSFIDVFTRGVEPAPQRRLVLRIAIRVGQVGIEGLSSPTGLLMSVRLCLSPGLSSLCRTHGRMGGQLLLMWCVALLQCEASPLPASGRAGSARLVVEIDVDLPALRLLSSRHSAFVLND